VTTAHPAYNTAEYQANRRLLLADHPACAIGGPRCTGRATTADHIVSIAEGGDNSLTNLRPSCAPCNGHLGGTLGRARQLRINRNTLPRSGFLGAPRDAGSPASQAMSPVIRRNPPTPEEIIAKIPSFGREQPRLATPVVGDGSYGPEIALWAKANLPHEPMAWNRIALEAVTATRRGRLVHRQALVSTARQNSKTQGVGHGLVGWWLTDLADRIGPQTVLWLAHDLRLSDRSFAFLARLLEHRITYKSHSFGRQRFELDNGSEFALTSNTAGAGHGFSVDLCVADESWKIKPAALDDGIIPAMRARPNPLLVMLSTAGDETSELLRAWRERGLTAIEHAASDPVRDTPDRSGSLCFLEWSMPPNCDPMDPTWWGHPNPALGVTLTAETLADESQGPRNAFLRAGLNVWCSSAETWLAAGIWDRTARRAVEPAGGVVACEVSMAGDRFNAVRAFQHNGVTHASVLISTEDESEFWGAVEAVYGDVDTVAITPTLEMHAPGAMARKLRTVGLRELARWVPLVRAMVNAGQVAHAPSALLDEHVARAVPTRTAGLSTAHSTGEISLARCLVWAVAMASRPSASRKPALGVARSG